VPCTVNPAGWCMLAWTPPCSSSLCHKMLGGALMCYHPVAPSCMILPTEREADLIEFQAPLSVSPSWYSDLFWWSEQQLSFCEKPHGGQSVVVAWRLFQSSLCETIQPHRRAAKTVGFMWPKCGASMSSSSPAGLTKVTLSENLWCTCVVGGWSSQLRGVLTVYSTSCH